MVYAIVHHKEVVVFRKDVFIDQVHASLLRRGAFSIAIFHKTTILNH